MFFVVGTGCTGKRNTIARGWRFELVKNYSYYKVFYKKQSLCIRQYIELLLNCCLVWWWSNFMRIFVGNGSDKQVVWIISNKKKKESKLLVYVAQSQCYVIKMILVIELWNVYV